MDAAVQAARDDDECGADELETNVYSEDIPLQIRNVTAFKPLEHKVRPMV